MVPRLERDLFVKLVDQRRAEASQQRNAAVRSLLQGLFREQRVLQPSGVALDPIADLNVAEGEALVVRPAGGEQYRLVGRIRPDEWAALLTPPGK